MIACEKEDTKMVNVLLDNGASINYINKVCYKFVHCSSLIFHVLLQAGVTAIHLACSKGNLELVQRLVNTDGSTQGASEVLQMTDQVGSSFLYTHTVVANFCGLSTYSYCVLLHEHTPTQIMYTHTHTHF